MSLKNFKAILATLAIFGAIRLLIQDLSDKDGTYSLIFLIGPILGFSFGQYGYVKWEKGKKIQGAILLSLSAWFLIGSFFSR